MSKEQLSIKTKLKNEFEKHLKIYDSIAKKYPIETDEFEEYNEFYDRLYSKTIDEKINFAVVGEFSTGKSTFVNAFLKFRFLESKVLQGTTTAATAVESGDEYKAVLEYTDLTKNTIKFRDAQDMKNSVDEYTVNPENTQKIKKVTFHLPGIALDSRMRIIDTPGTNVEHRWHEDVTRYSISHFCDVPIILLDATKVLPVSLIDFIEDNLIDKINYSVFVVTKIDCVEEKEIEDILKYVKIKLMQEFELEKPPIVLPYAPVHVLEFETNKKDQIPDEHTKRLLAISKRTEEVFKRFFDANHLSYLAKSFKHNELILCTEMKNSIELHRNNLREAISIDEEKLNRSKNFIPEYFKNNQIKLRTKSFNQNSGMLHASLSNKLQNIKKELLSRINFEIHNNSSIKRNTPQKMVDYFVNYFAVQTEYMVDECRVFFELIKGKYVYEMCCFLDLYKTTCNNISIILPKVNRKEFYDFMNSDNPEIDLNYYKDIVKNEITKIFIKPSPPTALKNSFATDMRPMSGGVLGFASEYYTQIIGDIMRKMSAQIDFEKNLMLNRFEKIVQSHKDHINEYTENLTLYMMKYEEMREGIDADIERLSAIMTKLE